MHIKIYYVLFGRFLWKKTLITRAEVPAGVSKFND